MVKHVPRLCLLLVALLLFVVAGGLAWVAGKPRSMESVVPLVEKALTPKAGGWRVRIAEGHMDWRRAQNLGALTLRGLRFERDDGKTFAVLPQVQVRLSPLHLLLGRVEVEWLVIPAMDIALTRGEDKALYLGFGQASESLPLAALAGAGAGGTGALPFAHARVDNARVFIRNAQGGLLLETQQAGLTLNRTRYGAEAALDTRFSYSAQEGSLRALVRAFRSDGSVTVAANLLNTPIGLLCSLSDACGSVAGISGALSGSAALSLRDGEVAAANATLIGKRMVIDRPEWFAEKLVFDEVKLGAQAGRGMEEITIKALSLQSPRIHLIASGEAKKAEKGWHIRVAASMDRFRVSNLYRFWPLPLAPDTRRWVTENITEGISPKSSVVVELKPEDFDARYFPDAFLSARIGVQNAKVRFLPGIAPITGVNGTVHFTGETMRASLQSGKLLSGTELGATEVFIPNLNDHGTPMETTLSLSGPARDAAQLLRHPAFTFDDTLKLDPESLQGRITAQLKLGFDAFSGKAKGDQFSLDGVAYDVKATLIDLAQRKLMGKLDVAEVSGELQASEPGFRFKGKGRVQGGTLEIALDQDAGKEVQLSASGRMSREGLLAYGLPDRKEIGAGQIGFDARLSVGKQTQRLERIALDMKEVALAVPSISWSKPAGLPGSLSIVREGAEDRYRIKADMRDLSAAGTLRLDPNTQALSALSLARIKTPRSDFALDYAREGEGMVVSLRGAALDNSASYDNSEHSLLADFPHIRLSLDLERLVLASAYPLSKAKGTLDCLNGPCVSADLRAALTSGGEVTGRIVPKEGKRHLHIEASDAGNLLRALDISDRVYGGKLALSGSYEGEALQGVLHIENFNVKQSELFGRLFGVASLSGLANLLTGSGIDFEKLRADITHRAGVVTLRNGRASGASMGYTTEGTVDTREAKLNLKGVLVPAYMLNSIVGKIPVIGALAGKEGEGLISFSYRIRGPYSDPEVFVNPLSALTPGFLRGIFDGEETAPPDAESSESSQPDSSQKGPADQGIN